MNCALEKYEEVLSNIDSNHEKSEQLNEKLQQQNVELIALSLLLKKDFPIHQLFKIDVKVYDTIPDLIYQNSSFAPTSFPHRASRIFYKVNFYVATCFKEKVAQKYLFFNVSVRNSRSCVCGTLSFKVDRSLIYKGPDASIVIPFENSTERATVDVNLFYCLENYWPEINVASIATDFSYHFSDKKSSRQNLKGRVFDICRMYYPDVNKPNFRSSVESFEIASSLDKFNLFRNLLKNCFHRVDVHKSCVCSSLDYLVTIRLTDTDNTVSTVKLDTNAKKIAVETTIAKLPLFKSLLFCEMTYEDLNFKQLGKKIKTLKQLIQEELLNPIINNDLLNLKLKELEDCIVRFQL